MVLVGIAIAAVVQIGSDDSTSTELQASADIGLGSSTPDTTLAPEPFAYRVGLLSGLTTDNFWAYIGEQPTVWNAYVLGPTKPALFALNAEQTALCHRSCRCRGRPTGRPRHRVVGASEPGIRSGME